MARFSVYKLHFTSPVHIGDCRDDYGISQKTISSDTIYAALTSCLAKLNMQIPDDGYLGCTVSGLFPFFQQNNTSKAILFFPKPLKQYLTDITAIDRKKIKKIQWLDKQYFEELIAGEDIFSDGNIQGFNFQGEYLSHESIDKDFVTSQVVPRVTVSRNHEDAIPFYMDRILFKGYSGLYFLAQGDTKLIDKSIELLQHEGLGTDRNIGNGFFVYEKSSLELEIPDTSEFAISLSSFIPESKEQLVELTDSEVISYDFQRRGGWITTPPYNNLRKNIIYAFCAGSILKQSISKVESFGKIVNLQPDIQFDLKVNHPIWRCGKAIFIPIKVQ